MQKLHVYLFHTQLTQVIEKHKCIKMIAIDIHLNTLLRNEGCGLTITKVGEIMRDLMSNSSN